MFIDMYTYPKPNSAQHALKPLPTFNDDQIILYAVRLKVEKPPTSITPQLECDIILFLNIIHRANISPLNQFHMQ